MSHAFDTRGEEAPQPLPHGGDLDAARRLFPGAPEPWLDLSTGINPVPYPCPATDASLLHRLPSAADLDALKAAAVAAYGVPDADHVVAAPGTQILIGMLPLVWPQSRVAVVVPTYAEHAHAWRRAGHDVVEVSDLDAVGEAQVVVAVSPNNPDGRVAQPATCEALARRLAARGGLFVIDQAFADLEPGTTATPREWSGLLCLRSFGKTYGLPGLRLGFALAEPALARRIEVALGPWAVSGPALAAGSVALADEAWRRETASARADDAARLDRMLIRGGARLLGGTSLFRTAIFDDASAVFSRLGEAGIYVRRFSDEPSWLRFGLPASKEDWCRLSRVLKPGAHG